MNERPETLKELLEKSLLLWNDIVEKKIYDKDLSKYWIDVKEYENSCPLCDFFAVREEDLNWNCSTKCILITDDGMTCYERNHPFQKWSQDHDINAASIIRNKIEAALKKEGIK